MAKKKQVTIAVDEATMKRLASHGRFQDSYKDIINRLLDICEQSQEVGDEVDN